jgi:hypothetical protein
MLNGSSPRGTSCRCKIASSPLESAGSSHESTWEPNAGIPRGSLPPSSCDASTGDENTTVEMERFEVALCLITRGYQSSCGGYLY